jgi:hypothetical protein
MGTTAAQPACEEKDQFVRAPVSPWQKSYSATPLRSRFSNMLILQNRDRQGSGGLRLVPRAAITTGSQNCWRNVARTLVSAAPRLIGALVWRRTTRAGMSPGPAGKSARATRAGQIL